MHYTIRLECLQERKANMNFFMGFLTSSILSAILFCIYVFLKEEDKKNRFNTIIPGQTYYVQSIGKVIIQGTDGKDVAYKDENQNMYSASCELFLSFSKLSLKETGQIQKITQEQIRAKNRSHKYYNNKGSVFDIYVD